LRCQVWTIDRNADAHVQSYIKYLFDINNIEEEKTITDLIGAGTATARSQFYGSSEQRSMWVEGQFDYRALSDYLPTRSPLFIAEGQSNTTALIKITDDPILEKPDEDFLVSLVQPGVILRCRPKQWCDVLGSPCHLQACSQVPWAAFGDELE
jgi:hypothetical protein